MFRVLPGASGTPAKEILESARRLMLGVEMDRSGCDGIVMGAKFGRDGTV